MIQTYSIYQCTNTHRHHDNVWVVMKVGQFDPPRRITFYCPECMSSIAVDSTITRGVLLTSLDEEEHGETNV